MSDFPLVSVIMGVYNCENTINSAVKSIQDQTYTNWEMIVCDDGSTDQTYKLVEEIAKRDIRIILLKNDYNKGLPYSLNRCIYKAKGEYCARMDGDDLCDPTRFYKQVLFLNNYPEYGFVSTTMKRFDEHGVYINPKTSDGYEPKKKDYIKGSPFAHAPTMIRKESYNAVDGYRVMKQTLGVEDYDLWFRLYEKGIKGYILREPLYSMYDGREAAKRRTFKRRINEAKIRANGYKIIQAPLYSWIYVLKPLLLAFIPKFLLKTKFRRKR